MARRVRCLASFWPITAVVVLIIAALLVWRPQPTRATGEVAAAPASERLLEANELVVRLDQPLAAATERLECMTIP